MKNREYLSDPLFMKKHQEFCIKQGGVGSQSGLNSGPVLEFLGNGARSAPGWGRLTTPEKGGSKGVVSDDKNLYLGAGPSN